MRAGGARVLLVALAAGGVLAVALAAAAAASGPREEMLLQPAEAEGRDAFVREAAPAANHGTAARLEVSEAQGEASRALLAFDLGALPANATLVEARLALAAVESQAWPRDLEVHRLAAPFDETTVTWATRPATAEVVARATLGTGETAVAFDLTEALRGAVERREPFHGIELRGDVPPPLQGPLALHSSGAAEAGARPLLRLVLDRNGPDVRNLTLDGAAADPADPAVGGPARDLAVRVEAHDSRGAIVDARAVVATAAGAPLRNVSLAAAGAPLDGWVPYEGVVGLDVPDSPDGSPHVVTVVARDGDGLWGRLVPGAEGRLVVERAAPSVRLAEAAARVVEAAATGVPEAERTARIVAAAADAHGIAEVRLAWQPPSGPAEEAHMAPAAGSPGTFAWEGPRAGPGRHRFTVTAVDRAGNANATGGILEVLDRTPPVVLDPVVEGLVPAADGVPEQEEGGAFAIALLLEDASPVLGRLVVLDPGGAEAGSAVLARDAGTGRFRAALPLALPPGDYAWDVDARSFALDGVTNAAPRAPRPFRVVAAAAPIVERASPADGAWVRGAPVVEAVVADHNLDPASLRLEATAGVAAARAAPRVGLEPGRARLALGPLDAPHGERVEARVEAADRGGLRAAAAWAFRVDARAPTTRLEVGDAAGQVPGGFGSVRFIVDDGAVVLRLQAEDDGSGVAAVEHRWTHLASGASTGFRRTVNASVELDVARVARDLGGGAFRLEYRALDLAGNVEATHSVLVVRDPGAPSLAAAEEGGKVVARLLGGAGDGVSLTLHVRTAEGVAAAPFAARGGGTFVAPLPPGARGPSVGWAVEAVDLLGRVTRYPPGDGLLYTSAAANRPPSLAFRAPADLALLEGPVTVRWRADDPDGDAVAVTLEARPVGRDALAVRIEPSGRGEALWETGAALNGPWELRAVAADGLGGRAEAALAVVLANPGRDAGPLRFEGRARTGGLMVVAVEVGGGAAQASLLLRAGDHEVAVPLADDGAAPDARAGDGVFAGAFAPPAGGAWQAALEVRRPDGSTLRVAAREPLVVQASEAEVAAGAAPWLVGTAAAVALWRLRDPERRDAWRERLARVLHGPPP